MKWSNENLTSKRDFGTDHILANVSINCALEQTHIPNSGLSLRLYPFVVYAGSKCSCESTHLHMLV